MEIFTALGHYEQYTELRRVIAANRQSRKGETEVSPLKFIDLQQAHRIALWARLRAFVLARSKNHHRNIFNVNLGFLMCTSILLTFSQVIEMINKFSPQYKLHNPFAVFQQTNTGIYFGMVVNAVILAFAFYILFMRIVVAEYQHLHHQMISDARFRVALSHTEKPEALSSRGKLSSLLQEDPSMQILDMTSNFLDTGDQMPAVLGIRLPRGLTRFSLLAQVAIAFFSILTFFMVQEL